MERERKIIKLTEYEMGPILCDYALEHEDYEDCYVYDEYEQDSVPNPEKQVLWDLWGDFAIMSEEVDFYDLEKAYEKMSTVVIRISDGRYFRGKWVRSNYCDNDYPTELEEVFPKEKTITVYE